MAVYKSTKLMADECTQIGRKVPLFDATPIVTGKALYAADNQPRLGEILHCKLLRSPHAHAKIKNIDTSEAEKMPGVEAVITYTEGFWHMLPESPYMRLPTDKACFVGDVVAAVAAKDEATAEEAVEKIKVEYEVLPKMLPGEWEVLMEPEKYGRVPIHTMESMMKSPNASFFPYMIFPLTKPKFDIGFGDLEAAFKKAEIIFEKTYYTQKHRTNLWEPDCFIAQWLPDGRLQVWGSFQTPYQARWYQSDSLNTSTLMGKKKFTAQDMNNIMPYTGMNHGTRGSGIRYDVIAALLAWKAGKPVKIELSREEMIRDGGGRANSKITLKWGVKKDGTITATDASLYWDLGAYNFGCWTLTTGGGFVFDHPVAEAARWRGWWLYSNTFSSFIRQYGAAKGSWALNTFADEVCEEIGMDLVDFWLKNNSYLLPEEELKKKHPPEGQVGETKVGNAMKECILKVTEAIGWKTRTSWKTKTGRYRRGLGFALANTYGYTTDSVEWGGDEAWVEISPQGVVTIRPGFTNDGTFRCQMAAKVVAEILKVPYESVQIIHGDTDECCIQMGQYASMIAHVAGNYFKKASEELRDKLLEEAAKILKEDVNTLNLKDGSVYVEGKPETKVSYAEVAQKVGTLSVKKRYITYHDRLGGMAGAAEVEVDTETGEVKVLKFVHAADVGKAVNPTVVRQQMEGTPNSLQLGYALTEDFVVDPATGQCLSSSNLEHKLPTILDIPKEIVPIIVEPSKDLSNWQDVISGIGEPPGNPVAPAIGNAIYNAAGVRIRDLPITPDKILKALKAGGG